MVFGSQLRMMMLFNLGWPRFASSPRAPHEGYAVTRPRIGLALGSGSARGWAHIGVIDALSEAGIEPDIVCGSSMGALVGAAHVAGHLAELRQWAEGATWRQILSPSRIDGKWLLDGGLSNPIPVSVCRALGADVIIAVNLNGELVGRRYIEPEPPDGTAPSRVSVEVVRRMFGKLPVPAALQRKETNGDPPQPQPRGE